MSSSLLMRFAVALVVVAPALACVATATSAPPRGVTVSGPPPAPIHEERPPEPRERAAWVPGYWHWTGIQYAWIPGHYETAPPPGVTWEGPKYMTADGAYFYEPGGWRGRAQPVSSARANALR